MKYKNLCRMSIRGAGGKESYSFVVLDAKGIPNGQTPNKKDIGNWFEEMKRTKT